MRSLRSFSFLRPAKAILVPGMYWGLKMSIIGLRMRGRATYLLGVLEILKQCLLVPCDTLVNIGSGVLVAFDLTSFTTEDPKMPMSDHPPSYMGVELFSPVQVGSNLVGLARADSMALCATRLEKGGTLASVTCTQSQRLALRRGIEQTRSVGHGNNLRRKGIRRRV